MWKLCWSALQLIQTMLGKRSLQRQFFGVLYDISAVKPTHAYLTITILAVYLMELLFAYTALSQPSHSIVIAILHSPLVALCIIAIVGVVVIQLVVAFAYRLQFQLQLQLIILRFVLLPIALLQLVAQTQDPRFMPAKLAFSLFLPTVAVAYFSNFVVHSFWNCSISRSFEKASAYFVITDALFILARLPSRFLDLQALVVLQLVIHLLVRHKLVRYNLAQTRQHLEYYSMLLKDFLAVLYLAQRAYIIGGDALLLLLFSLPLLVAAMARELARRRLRVMEGDIFSGNARVQVFLQEMQRMGVELQRFKNNQDLDLQGSLLVVFVAAHSRNCNNSGCLLLQKSTEQEMRNCNSSNNMKILKHKIIKKMESLFELYDRNHLDSPALKLHRLHFYVKQLPNKTKISLLTAALNSLALNWHQRMALFGLERRVEGVAEGAELGGAKGEQEFLEFKKLLVLAVGCFQDFWSQLVEERVDLRQLGGVSSRLFPIKKAIETAWRRHLNRQQFSSWNVLRTYTYYRRNILHDYTNSVILEDYCKIVEQRLKAKHEMSYINSATEQAVLAISLTESSLGNLASMNSQTCKLFSFASRAEMLERRVNDIMPSVYSVVHDNILSSFLKNRFKNINQDLRFVFGKNKNGFIFPFHLQLRKLSWNVNDELIFIAHLEPARLRAAPIYCIADLEGDLQDFTSTFAWLFMKKAKDNREIKRKNIQEMIPSFFEAVEGSEGKRQGQRVRFHQFSYSNKNGHNIQIEFWASELYIKAEKVGYLVEGINTHSLKSIVDHKNISSMLSNWQRQGALFYNVYSPSTLTYQIANKSQESNNNTTKEFTIPFLRTSDIEGIFKMKQEPHVYGKNIKTLRLVNGKLEHLIEEESFHSDQDSFEMKELSVIKKIQKMREQLSLQKPHPPPDHFRLILAVFTGVLTLLAIVALLRIPLFRADESRRLQEMQGRLQVRQLLPEYLIFSLFHPTPSSPQVLREQLKDSLARSSIAQLQKEQIMRVIFESSMGKDVFVDVGVLSWEWDEEVGEDGVVTWWWVIMGANLLFLLALAAIYLLFRLKLAEIYMVFLSVGEQKLMEMQHQAKKLLQFLSAQNTEYYKVAPLQEFRKDEPEQAEFHRLKKLKDEFTSQDCLDLVKLLLPALFLFAFALAAALLLNSSIANYKSNLSAWLACAQLYPDTSVSLLNALLPQQQLIPQNLLQLEARFQFVALSGGMGKQNLLQLLQGDSCQQQSFYHSLNIPIANFCTNSSKQISLTNVLNYMTAVLRSQNASAPPDWKSLIDLQFGFVKPLLGFVSSSLAESLTEVRTQCEQTALILAVVFVSLVGVASLYILCYPLTDISQRLLFTSDLVKLLPDDRERQPEHALAAMTTQAMDTS